MIDIYFYYTSSYPLLLIIGAYKRIKRRIKYLWFPKGPGRPPFSENIIDLILDMKRSNLLWGALRISQELKFLGISIHKKTVSRILRENGFTTPPMKYQPPTWEALLAGANETWVMDFCNVIDLKMFQIYVIGIINIQTREVILLSVTLSPHRQWILQQFRNLAIENIKFPDYLIIDNDRIYGNWAELVFKDYFGIKTLRITPKSPWQNGIIERFWKSLQVECIWRLHIQNEDSIRYFCHEYKNYYNKIRPHQGLDGGTPKEVRIVASNVFDLNTVKYKKQKHLHGLFTEFSIVA
ncbi:MAG: integrase core domain-containing protein [Deltaproteobacteria bacterium]|nr:integrase core domain-containing protein [Deltaproteobacteria bacterium]